MMHEYVPTGVPFLRSLNVRPFRIDTSDLMFIGEAFNARIAKSALKPGDVVVVRTGTPGVAAVIPESLPRANCADLVVIHPGPNLDPRFLVYYINGVAQSHIGTRVVGAVQQHYNIGSAKQMLVVLPSLREQQAISGLLGALDDKIAANLQTNQTLEEMASILFRSWFVDFDPVFAKASGIAPIGMDAETAALFPTSLEDSELGARPRGWRTVTLADVATTTVGKSYTSAELSPSEIGLVSLKSIRRGGGYRADGLKAFVGKFKEEQAVEPGEIVIACTDVTQQAAVIGRAALVEHDPRFKRLVASMDLVIIRPILGTSREFLYQLLRTQDYIEWILGWVNGTTVLHLKRDGLRRYSFTLPGSELLDAFRDRAAPMHELAQSNSSESQVLADLRDTLLPQLLSGKIRLQDAERAVGAVA
jgi:type I restriction enzyme S subunit